MKIGNRKIDHLVYGVPDLEEGIAYFKKVLGVEAHMGGRHLNHGTHNALINLGAECYLEIIAIDYNNKDVQAPRWMGLDLLLKPKLVRWSLKSEQLAQDCAILQTFNPALCTTTKGERKTTTGDLLAWQMTKPLASPEVEIIPFLLDWPAHSVHPTKNLALQAELLSIDFGHPNAVELQTCFEHLGIKATISASSEVTIQAQIRGALGAVTI